MVQIRKFTPLVCLLLLLLATACSNAAQPVASPTATPKLADLDTKSVLRDFLASLPADWNLIASQEVVRIKPFVVDVRQPDEYAQGFIAGAVNIPLRDLVKNLQALPGMDKDIVVVCNTGHRAAIGMAVLQMLGYKKAKSLDGGMQCWQADKLQVVTAPIPPRPSAQAPKVNAQLVAMLDYYLLHTLPYDWGNIDAATLTTDQKRISSAESDIQPESFDQGPSLIVDVDEPDVFAKANLDPSKSLNVPLRQLPDGLDKMPLADFITWA